ncbi:Miro-like_protein/Ras_family/Gtr1/RagA_G_protein_conserved_region_containing_protein [Leishmania braziliensis MHOM/BR/75/M2904]|uniref:Miro-like_protein/Ras_family/Gtr1/RagA_G_protein_ conserved_region_containing_protein n=1 Tax=Leishmania braziliensis MHOM/BR/75/M2904 TaxID=420245 RepID=A0A3P3ZFM4_LEIBR|nr:Miro-like_protein/Ras_family/Gtr1/RagA_G_protein_conserved_region_containing_protein [Leishmania braziliensis MHOM/BR/75/M2904]
MFHTNGDGILETPSVQPTATNEAPITQPPPPKTNVVQEVHTALPARNDDLDDRKTPLRCFGANEASALPHAAAGTGDGETESPPPKAPTQAQMVEIRSVVSSTAAAAHVDPSTIATAVVVPSAAREAGPGPVVQGRVLYTSAEPRAVNDLPITRGRVMLGVHESVPPAAVVQPAAVAVTSGGIGSGAQQLSDLQQHLLQMREQTKGQSLMARYVLQNAARDEAHSSSFSATATTADTHHPRGIMKLVQSVPRLRFRSQQVHRRKITLLGYQEVGKTSLRKCFESEPFFFKDLPDVRTTTGVEVQEKSMTIDSETVHLILSDFAGQESYHSHTYFLTERSIFLLVWKLSAVEQDFQSSGINAREEKRLQRWIAEVFAKYPHARIVLVATHLDELRVQGQRSVEMILNKVEGKLRSYIDDLIAASNATAAPTPGTPALTSSSTTVGGASSPQRSRRYCTWRRCVTRAGSLSATSLFRARHVLSSPLETRCDTSLARRLAVC